MSWPMILYAAYLNRTISPSLQLVSGIDECLNSCSINMCTAEVISIRLECGKLEGAYTPEKSRTMARRRGL